MTEGLLPPPRPPAEPGHEQRTHSDVRSDAVRHPGGRPAPIRAPGAALTTSVRADTRRVHP